MAGLGVVSSQSDPGNDEQSEGGCDPILFADLSATGSQDSEASSQTEEGVTPEIFSFRPGLGVSGGCFDSGKGCF